MDASALTEPVSRADVREHRRRIRAGRSVSPTVFVVPVLLGLFVVGGGIFLVTRVSQFSDDSGLRPNIPLAPIIVAAVIWVVTIVRLVMQLRGNPKRAYRLDNFARDNGMTWTPDGRPQLPGMIFQIGSSRKTTDIIRGTDPRVVEFANFEYKVKSRSRRRSTTQYRTVRWGFVAIRLTVPLPHIVLDAKGNNGLLASNLPIGFSNDQRLSLEGDFDKYFSLYCPAGYERDALYLFTPDIMARLVDNAAQLDVEIVDDWLLFYARRPLVTLDPATWQWLFSVVAAMLQKLAQWERWRDDRLTAPASPPALPFTASTEPLRPPPGVAPEGRRLERRSAWVPVLIVAGVVIAWGIAQFLFRLL